MSYFNKGLTKAVAIVTSDVLGSGNFTFRAGTDDPSVTIEAAWSYLNDLGGGTLVTKGPGETWIAESQINSQGPNVKWLSDWSLTIKETGDGGQELPGNNGLNAHLIKNVHDYVTIEGLRLDGNKANQRWPSDDGWSYENNLIHSEGVKHCKFKNNFLYQAKEYGISCVGFVGDRLEEIDIYGNHCTENGWNGITVEDYLNDIRITANYVEHSSDVAIACPANGTGNQNLLINNNTVFDMDGSDGGGGNAQWGIAVEGDTTYVSIMGNTVNDCKVGIHTNEAFDNGLVAIVGNSVRNIGTASWQGGISCRGDIGYGSIYGNVVTQTVTGVACILIEDGPYYNICGNTLYSATSGVNGVSLINADNTLIASNLIAVPATGIIVDGSSDDVAVVRNKFGSCTTGLSILTNADRTVVDSNDFYQCTTDVSDSGTNTRYGGNKDQSGNWDENAEP